MPKTIREYIKIYSIHKRKIQDTKSGSELTQRQGLVNPNHHAKFDCTHSNKCFIFPKLNKL